MKLKSKIAALSTTMLLAMSSTAVYAQEPGQDKLPDPVDPQSLVLQKDMTWNDYQPVPGIDWSTTDIKPETELKGALILVDFPGQDFILTKPKGSEIVGNPQIDPIPRKDLAEWWRNYLNVPSELNHHQTIDGFWKENSYGKWGVTFDAYGPYRLDKHEFQYGLDGMNPGALPSQYKGGNLFQDAIDAAKDDLTASGKDYDFAFIVHAGYDESTVWQELGEMKFQNQDSVPDEFGPPNLPGFEDKTNWAPTRYVPWTSWYAAKSIWSATSNATLNGKSIRLSIQGESDGMSTFAHEFGHIRGLGDNYNNAAQDGRTYAGYWETMSRGAFNGPGGTHTRWMIPATHGSSMPSPHTLRNKIKQGFTSDDEVLKLNRDELKNSGPKFSDITAREDPIGSRFGRSGLHGINISMDDLTPDDYLSGDWRNDMLGWGKKGYDNYTLEVVDRDGADSFQTDSGVLISKTKNSESAPSVWVVDSHPEDINLKDFTRPDGTTAMVTKGDPRQLDDALFHAGNGGNLVSGNFESVKNEEGVVSEYTDPYNHLHFYVLGKYKDDDGTLHYKIAVRNTESAGIYKRGVNASADKAQPAVPGRVAVYHFNVTNTGEAKDLIRIKASAGNDWKADVKNNVLAVDTGKTVDVPVYVKIPEGKTAPTKLTFTATSETDSSQSTTVSNFLPGNLSATGLKSVVESFDKDGAFQGGAAHALELHLTAVAHYEKQKAADKVVKHMNGFKTLLNHQKETNVISEKAYDNLKADADAMIEIWQ